MKIPMLIAAFFALAIVPAVAADDVSIERLAICKDSWLDWQKTNPAQMQKLGENFRANFSRKDNDPYFLPNTNVSIEGLRVLQAFPESVGMGVGFSLLLDVPFDKARKVFGKTLGKPLGKCETGDGMHMCELDIADKRTFTLMAEDAELSKTLVGCYYFYEK